MVNIFKSHLYISLNGSLGFSVDWISFQTQITKKYIYVKTVAGMHQSGLNCTKVLSMKIIYAHYGLKPLFFYWDAADAKK